MKKEIKKLIKRTVGGGEHKDWFMELEEGIEDMLKKARISEGERILQEIDDTFKSYTNVDTIPIKELEDIIKHLNK